MKAVLNKIEHYQNKVAWIFATVLSNTVYQEV